MYLAPFEIHRPRTLGDAVELRAALGGAAALYAGGTELVLAMKMGVLAYDHLIDLKHVDGLCGIDVVDGALEIGATVTHRELERSGTVGSRLPALASLESSIANIRVRAAGTLAGNLAFAEPHADPPTLLRALGAQVRLHGSGGTRVVGLNEFLVGAYETALADDELIAAISVPIPDADTRVRYLRFKVLERPTIGVAAVCRVSEGRFDGAPTVVVGAVDETPRALCLNALAGMAVADDAAIAAAAEAVQAVIEPVDDLSGSAEYKRHLANVLVRRAVAGLAEDGVQ